MNSAISLVGVSKRFGQQQVFKDLSLEIPKGSVTAILGANGAGKTTMLQIILGLLAPNEGKVVTLGLDALTEGDLIRQRVGYVAESPVFYDWMTVAEVGWFVAGFQPAKFQRQYQELIARFSLPTNKRIRELSKGMRAKVALALAIAPEPELLVLDEPTSGLDPLVRREFLESMADLAGEGNTVVLSTDPSISKAIDSF